MELVDEDEDPWELELARKVENGELRMEKALRRLRLRRTQELEVLLGRRVPGVPVGGKAHALQQFGGIVSGITADEVRVSRATEDLLETYRRLTRPEKVGRLWSLARWSLVAATLAKLRCVANVAYWELPAPAVCTSREPKALADTGMTDPASAAAHIDSMEGEIDARLLRVASRMVSFERSSAKVSKLSPEVWALLRLSLLNLRNTAARLELLFNEKESRPAVMDGIHHTYGALAASLACLRQRLGDEIGEQLRASQEPLMFAAQAACSLGVGGGTRLGSRPVRAKGHGKAGAHGEHPLPISASRARGDPFLPLHQAILLTNIASLTEVASPRSASASAGLEEASKKMPDVLARLIGGVEEVAIEKTFTADDANWNIEFTASQLAQMRQATKDCEPKVRGAQQLLADTLDCYTTVADAMSCAYSDESVLRANPGSLGQHSALLKLSRHLQGLWKDAGAVLVESRIKDLMALEGVRLRHESLILRAIKKGGIDFATVVLARLTLVDEMLQDPEMRLITGELKFELIKPYQLVESTVRSLCKDATNEQRRRRWLRCPHATMHSVLAGEVWRQLLQRFVTVESAFEPLRPCEDIPLSLRDFRIVLCLLEITVSDRVAVLLHEAASDIVGGQATVKGLLDLVLRYGPTTSGDHGVAAGVAAAASRALAHGMKMGLQSSQPRTETPQTREHGTSGKRASMSVGRRGASKRPTVSAATAVPESGQESSNFQSLNYLPDGAPMVSHRCLDGDVPLFPYASAQELNRNCCLASLDTDVAAPVPSSAQASSDQKKEAGDGLAQATGEEEIRFGEDAIVSWTTAVLTQNILLSKDERGIYFKWLARIVLRTGTDGETSKARSDVESELASHRIRTGTNRRASFNVDKADVEAHTKKIRGTTAETEASPKKKSIIAIAGGISDAGSKMHPYASAEIPDETPDTMLKVSANTMAISDADWEAKEFEEAVREVSVALPDRVLNVLRIDLGLTAVGASADSETHEGEQKRPSLQHARKVVGPDFIDHIAKGGPSMIQKMKRAARVGRVCVGLRHLNVQESEIGHLERELKIVSENAQPHGNGILLVAGAARAAQSILAKAAPEEQDGNDDLSSGAGKKGASRLAVEPDKEALDVIDHSNAHNRGCYDRCGYDDCADKVAVALRSLEHELFQGARVRSERGDAQPTAAAGAGSTHLNTAATASGKGDANSSTGLAGTEETVASLVPLLLPKQTSDRLLAQAQREWEIEEAARIAAEEEEAMRAAEAKLGFSSGYKDSRVQKRKTPALPLQPIVRVKSIETQDSGSASEDRESASRHATSPTSGATRSGSSGSPRSGPRSQRDSHRSQRESHSRGSRRSSRDGGQPPHAPPSRSSVAATSEEGRPASTSSSFPAIPGTPPGLHWTTYGASNEVLMWRDSLSDWPYEVLQLFHSVDTGCRRIRGVVTHSETWRTQQRNKLLDMQHARTLMDPRRIATKSKSDTDMFLPRVKLPASSIKGETHYKKANAASRVVSGKWGWTQRSGKSGAKAGNGANRAFGTPRQEMQQSVGFIESGAQAVRRCGSSPAFL